MMLYENMGLQSLHKTGLQLFSSIGADFLTVFGAVFANTWTPSVSLSSSTLRVPRRQNVAAQVAEEFKTITYATPPMQER